jgi:hypothetical protein
MLSTLLWQDSHQLLIRSEWLAELEIEFEIVNVGQVYLMSVIGYTAIALNTPVIRGAKW